MCAVFVYISCALRMKNRLFGNGVGVPFPRKIFYYIVLSNIKANNNGIIKGLLKFNWNITLKVLYLRWIIEEDVLLFIKKKNTNHGFNSTEKKESIVKSKTV